MKSSDQSPGRRARLFEVLSKRTDRPVWALLKGALVRIPRGRNDKAVGDTAVDNNPAPPHMFVPIKWGSFCGCADNKDHGILGFICDPLFMAPFPILV